MMIVNQSGDGNLAVLQLNGRFTFDGHRIFRDAYKNAIETPAISAIQVDLGAVDYIDSSALGMLLLLRENAQAAGKTVALKNACGAVLAVLGIANFKNLFDIS